MPQHMLAAREDIHRSQWDNSHSFKLSVCLNLLEQAGQLHKACHDLFIWMFFVRKFLKQEIFFKSDIFSSLKASPGRCFQSRMELQCCGEGNLHYTPEQPTAWLFKFATWVAIWVSTLVQF